MNVAKGLVIREPWIDLILSGEKSWEMRSTRISFRSWIGLIRKGSGLVSGIARIESVGDALSAREMIETFDKHRIPQEMIRSGAVAKWNTPWKLTQVHVLPQPVPYRHPNGAITLFTLDASVSAAIAEQIGVTGLSETTTLISSRRPEQPTEETFQPHDGPQKAATTRTSTLVAEASSALLGEAKVTEGNIKNDHFYLRSFLNRFPEDLVGGRDLFAPVLAKIEAAGMRPTNTDICPRHKFFRDRSWTRAFLATADAEPGDNVRVQEVAPYHYRVSLIKKERP